MLEFSIIYRLTTSLLVGVSALILIQFGIHTKVTSKMQSQCGAYYAKHLSQLQCSRGVK